MRALHRREADEIERALPEAAAPGRRLQHRHDQRRAATTWRICWSAPKAPSPSSTRSSSTCSRSRRTGCSASAISRASTRRWRRPSTSSSSAPAAVELVDRTMIELARDIPMFRATRRPLRPGRAGGDPARPNSPATTPTTICGGCRQLVELMGDLGFPGAVDRGDRPRLPERGVERPQGRPQHHDVDEGRRETDLLYRGLRGAARRPRRIHRPADPGLPQARHLRHLVRARLGRHACMCGRCST